MSARVRELGQIQILSLPYFSYVTNRGDSISKMAQFLHLFLKSESIPLINSKPNHIIYSRETSQENSQQGGSTRGLPFASNPGTTIKPVGREVRSSIPGLNRTLFIAVVSTVVVLSLAVFILICCWHRRRHNIRRIRSTLPTGRGRGLPGLGDKELSKRIYDAPRPDSTTLPIHGILMHISTRGLVRQTTRSPLGNPNGAISNKLSYSQPSIYQNCSKPRSALGPAAPPPAVLRFPTIAPNPKGNYRSPIFPPGPQAVVQFPTIASFASNLDPPLAIRGTPATKQFNSVLKASVARNKLQKKTRPKFERIPELKPIIPFPIISTFAGFDGASTAGSMSNYSTSWWESSSDEGEGDRMKKK